MRKRYENEELNPSSFPELEHYHQVNKKVDIHSVRTVVAVIFCGGLLFLYYVVRSIDSSLPSPLNVNDEKVYKDAFITERAHHDLKLLTEIGPRVVGSYENEVLAVDFLKREIQFILNTKHPLQQIEFDVQVVTGSYYLNYKPAGAINSYANVQNVVVKVFAENATSNSILINAHFDSVPTSPGGSDDGINCAVMLEVLRKVSRSPNKPLHNLIFLFNGAEETPLQAAHGFITQHKWAKEAKVIINLDAAGAGGKEVLFQTGPNAPWLLKYYAHVPHPNGQATGEEIFHSNIIPSDTDFRIFRDFGGLVGYDMAFIANGYRYHTKYDNFTNIPMGSIQHVGDNVLSLVNQLKDAPEISNIEEQEKGSAVYYGFLFFMVNYSENTAYFINLTCVILSVLLAVKGIFMDFGLGFTKSSLYYTLQSGGSILLGWLCAAIFMGATALFLDFMGFTMSWYNHPWLLLPIYVLPTIMCSCWTITFLNRFNQKPNLCISIRTQINLHVLRLVWTAIVLIGTLFGIRSSYAVMLPVFFSMLGMASIQLFHLQHSVKTWRLIYIVSTLAPLIFLMQQSIKVFDIFIPVTGRMGSDKNPELIIGAIVFALTLITCSFYTPLILIVQKPQRFLWILFVIFGAFMVVIFTPMAFPYSGNVASPAPQRFWTIHTSRTFRNETNHIIKKDSGFFLLNLDRNSPSSVRKYMKDFNKAKSVEEDCKLALFCGLPLSSSRMVAVVQKSTWIPSGQPIIHEPISLSLISRNVTSAGLLRLTFSALGPDRLNLYVSPKGTIKLKGTNLTPEVPENAIEWNGNLVYFIHHTCGKDVTPFNFYLDFEVPPQWNSSIVDIAMTGIYVHNRNNIKTPHYQQFLMDFPNWADVVPYLGSYEHWIY